MRPLDPVELRVLGALLEKQLTTPEVYPLTLNALRGACNQKTNREPVMELSDGEIDAALHRLQDLHLVWRTVGERAARFDHNLEEAWALERPSRAVMTLLLLRGPQTPAELRARSERLYVFGSGEEVEAVLRSLVEREFPLVIELPRQPGQKERRWMHNLSDSDLAARGSGDVAAAGRVPRLSYDERLTTVERKLDELRDAVEQLKRESGSS